MKAKSSQLSAKEWQTLQNILEQRFKKNMHRHKGMDWAKLQKKLEKAGAALWSLWQMEESGGEPDVVSYNSKSGNFIFFDCATETPKNRRSLCYDDEALESRKEHKPKDSAVGLATTMGIELLTEEEYFLLQKFENVDLKTSSWLKTPAEVRKKGGAIFGDNRFGRVFIYHNGAESYYAARGFRGKLII